MVVSVADNMDYEQDKGIGKYVKVNFDVPPKEADSLSRNSSTSSSSLSDSSAVIARELSADPHLESRELTPCPPPLQPPPVQIMGAGAGYDANRIPLSIFAPKPSNPADWSVASNESLFSIHMGNNSFSRDHFILANRSGELPIYTESNNIPPPLSPVMEEVKVETRKENVGNSLEERGVSTESSKVAVPHMAPRDHIKEHMPPIDEVRSYVSVSHRSDESNNSTCSFQFPVFAGDGGRSSSVTTDLYMQHSQNQLPEPQIHETTPKSTFKKWFSSFSCCLPCRCRCF